MILHRSESNLSSAILSLFSAPPSLIVRSQMCSCDVSSSTKNTAGRLRLQRTHRMLAPRVVFGHVTSGRSHATWCSRSEPFSLPLCKTPRKYRHLHNLKVSAWTYEEDVFRERREID